MADIRTIASGLRFPEGPVALPDGSVLVVEIARGTLSRVSPDGEVTVVAECGGAPNGAAMGPDGKVYLCNNGGYYRFDEVEGVGLIPVPVDADAHEGGSIQRVDLDTGEVETLYTECDGNRLVAPNDLVFDDTGHFWFTDHGLGAGDNDQASVLYAAADGSSITGVIYGVDHGNGIGLAPDGGRLYVAETMRGTVVAWDLVAPGVPATPSDRGGDHGGSLLYDAPQGHLYDSLAVDGDGWVDVATIGQGGITSISPDGNEVVHIPVPDPIVTNICFAGKGADTVAYITASAGGTLVAMDWPRPGLALAH